MKILFVTSEIPYPPDNGVRIKSFNSLHLMSQTHQTFLLVLTPETDEVENRANQLRKLCKEVKVVSLRNRSRIDILISSLFRSRLFFIERYRDKSFQATLNQAIKEWQPDVVHFDLIVMSQYGLLIDSDIGKIASINDSYSLTLENELKNALHHSFWKKLYKFIQLKFTKKYEPEIYSHYDYCHVMTMVDGDYLKKLNPELNVIAIPNGVDINYFKPLVSKPISSFNNAIFVAKMSGANLLYLERFLKNTWKLVRNKVPGANLNVIGGYPPPPLKMVASEIGGVSFKGYVHNLKESYDENLIGVIPVQKNCGIVNKAIEAMSMELAVVGFNETFAGIPKARHKVNCISCKNHEEMAAEIIQLFESPEQAVLIGKAAREVIENHYSWQSRREAYEKMYKTAIKLHKGMKPQ